MQGLPPSVVVLGCVASLSFSFARVWLCERTFENLWLILILIESD